MSTIIQLSSSPPRVFARSPTRVDFSSPPRSVNRKLHEDSIQLPRESFQSARDAFSDGFVSARKVLGNKSGAENIPPLQMPKISTTSLEHAPPTPNQFPRFLHHSPERCSLPTFRAKVVPESESIEDSECVIVKVLPSDLRKNKKQPTKKAPTKVNAPPTRRTDWTPPRYATVWDDDPETRLLDFGNTLAQYGHVEENSSTEKLANTVDGEFTKRRKVDVVKSRPEIPTTKPTTASTELSKTKARSRSPAKKSLTITGLATSNYLGQEQEHTTPMMQYLVSTQAKMGDDQTCSTFETKVKKRNVTKGKKQRPKSMLKSPQTVLRTLESQELIFASASQLARDEELASTHEPVEIEQAPDLNILSDPCLTQQTAVASIEATTPKVGTSRYRARRSLWSAADRDDDNALLHLHDSFDTPLIRDAFAGKDALLEQVTSNLRPQQPSPKFDGHEISNSNDTVFDISEVTTPVLINSAKGFPSITKRTCSSSVKSPSSKRTKTALDCKREKKQQSSRSPSISKLIPSKPNHTLLSDDDLKRKLKELGVKGMRKRENMIKRLDTMWASEHGVELCPTQPAKKVVQHGDLLSKVHDFTQRPAPKTKKARVVKTKPDESSSKAAIKSRKSKRKEESDKNTDCDPGDADEITQFKAVKNSSGSDPVMDVDLSVCGTSTQALLDDEVFEPSTAPVRGTGVKASSSLTSKSKFKDKGKARAIPQILTPPPTFPVASAPLSSPGFDDLTSVTSADTNPPDASLKSKITLSLKYINPNNKSRRNHQTDPTWWEKIQMYDPIVLEDFTRWLNTEGFDGIGEDGEIDAHEVKAWCEEVGVCCLWKGGWRANKSGKSGD